jgi:hypothetical protein
VAEWAAGTIGHSGDVVDPAEEDTMERMQLDLDFARRCLDGAEVALRQLTSAAAPGAVDLPATQVRGVTQTAMSALADLGKALSLSEVEIRRVPCPSCGRMVMPVATRCGYCWHALSPKTGD